MTTTTDEELVDVTDRLRNEAKVLHDMLDQMQRDLDAARERLAQEHELTRLEAQEQFDELVETFRGNLDELRLQLHLGEMEASDLAKAVKVEIGHLVDLGRATVRRLVRAVQR
jgi:hypothetical protein